MQAEVGDELIVKGPHVGDPERKGVVREVHGAHGAPPYLVRWADGHESSFFPSGDTVVAHTAGQHGGKAGNRGEKARSKPGGKAGSKPGGKAGAS